MRRFISPLADDTLGGFWAWYARQHVARCPQCTAVLHALRDLRARLGAMGTREAAGGAVPVVGVEGDALDTESLLRRAREAWEHGGGRDDGAAP